MTLTRAMLPVLGLLINTAVQIIVSRAGCSLLRSVFAGFGAGFLIVAVLSGMTLNLPGDLICYCALGYCYFHFINLGETARRIRLIRELYEHAEALSEDELLSFYNSREILAVRMKRLLGNGQLLFKDGRYLTGRPTMLLISRLIMLMKLIVTGKESEFG